MITNIINCCSIIRAVKTGNLTRSDLIHHGHLVNQFNPAHLLVSQKNLNPVWSTTGW